MAKILANLKGAKGETNFTLILQILRYTSPKDRKRDAFEKYKKGTERGTRLAQVRKNRDMPHLKSEENA